MLIFQAIDDQIILKWGSYPPDLDLHLAIFDICEVSRGNMFCDGAFLDRNGPGSEIITIENYHNTTYMAYVNCCYGNCANSDIIIDIIPEGYDSITVNYPTDQDTGYHLWLIGCFNGSTEGSNEGLNNIKIANVLLEDIPYCPDDWSQCEKICNTYSTNQNIDYDDDYLLN